MSKKIRPSEEVVLDNIQKWNVPQPEQEYSVLIHCSTYNHGKYIKDALEGFVMQKCSFPFCAIIIDDCSMDNNVEIIRDYAEKYPKIIKPILLGENHMQHGVLRDPYFEKWHRSAKYIAECEGDDYWTDPFKLQKQFDFMESHPQCSLCFHASETLYPNGEAVINRPPVIKSLYTTVDVILGGGDMMSTNSMFYRRELKECEKPSFWENSPVGDLPARLYLALKGPFGYINETMSVYRLQAEGSWSMRQTNSWKKRKAHSEAILRMFDEYDRYTKYKYHSTIRKKKRINKINYYKGLLLCGLNVLISAFRRDNRI